MLIGRRATELERLERKALRSEREAAAGKLLASCPDLMSLDIAIHETRPRGTPNDTHYIRRVVVEHAPALFDVSCTGPRCQGGGYHVTDEILAALAARRKVFEGRQACRGRCGDVDCDSSLLYVATATYRRAKKTR